MTRTPEIFGSSIVAVGSFNPPIITPGWLESNALIGADDTESLNQSESILISRQVTVLETEWFQLQVEPARFTLISKGAVSDAFKDLAVGILGLVPHTPVSAIGINFLGHYQIAKEADYFKIGDTLAPKKIWKNIFPGEEKAIGLGNLQIRIQPCKRGELPKDNSEQRILVQPSGLIKSGIFIEYNNHRDLLRGSAAEAKAKAAAKIIKDEWGTIWKESLEVFDKLIESAIKEA